MTDISYVSRNECERCRINQDTNYTKFDNSIEDLRIMINDMRNEYKYETTLLRNDFKSEIERVLVSHQSFTAEMATHREQQYKTILYIMLIIIISFVSIILGRSIDFGWMLT